MKQRKDTNKAGIPWSTCLYCLYLCVLSVLVCTCVYLFVPVCTVCTCVYLYVLSVLQLGLVLSLLVLQSVLFGFNKIFVVAAVTVKPLGVQVDDVCDHGIQEVSVVGDDQDGGLPGLQGRDDL